MTRADVTFTSQGSACSAWHFRATSDLLAGPGGRPVVVMAHGFGGTKDRGSSPSRSAYASAGADVFAFDYRGFGGSEGQPRQTISIRRQVQDYWAAIDAAKGLPYVDQDRIAIWGSSMSGSHVLHVAADRDDVAAVIAMTPLTSGIAAGRAAIGQRSVFTALSWMATGVASRISVARGRGARLMPLVAHPGQRGALALEGAYEELARRWLGRPGATRSTVAVRPRDGAGIRSRGRLPSGCRFAAVRADRRLRPLLLPAESWSPRTAVQW